MSDPSAVTPEEARALLYESGETGEYLAPELIEASKRLARTVATEPDRRRAAVVKALRDAAQRVNWFGQPDAALQLADDADAYENGADFA